MIWAEERLEQVSHDWKAFDQQRKKFQLLVVLCLPSSLLPGIRLTCMLS
jgi:hypothetical protein